MIGQFNIYDIAVLFCACAGFLFACVNFVRTGNIKHLFNNVNYICEEVENMRYKLPDERQATKQSFSETKKEYIYDENAEKLVETGETINIQKMIDSALPTALETILRKYLDSGSIIKNAEDKAVFDYTDMRDALELRTDYINKAEDYREQLGLPLTMSVDEIYAFLDKNQKKLKLDIENVVKVKKEEGDKNA